jgi:acyl carrier protein
METNVIEDLVIRSLNEVIQVLNVPISGPINLDTRLFGPKGVLKSIELVSLIVDLEEKIADEYCISLILADERAMSQKKSPFRTVSSLAQYISMLLQEIKQNAGFSS